MPARVVVGTFTPKNGKVEGRDVQAWVELRVRDGSWRILRQGALSEGDLVAALASVGLG